MIHKSVYFWEKKHRKNKQKNKKISDLQKEQGWEGRREKEKDQVFWLYIFYV